MYYYPWRDGIGNCAFLRTVALLIARPPCQGDNAGTRNRMIARQMSIALLAGTLVASSDASWAQRVSNWRIYRTADGLSESSCISITISPQGKVITRHLVGESVSELDGYSATTLPSPESVKSRVYGSPAGQLWVVVPNGLMEFKDGNWLSHPVPEIAAELQTHNRGIFEAVPLYPIRQGLVLVLLPKDLLEINCEDPQRLHTEVLLHAKDTPLENFIGMNIARDGGLWVTGARGLMKAGGPVRSLKPQTDWHTYQPPAEMGIHNLAEPHEDDDRGVTMVGESSTNPDQKLVAYFDGQQWRVIANASDKMRQSWRGADKLFWAFTGDSLLNWEESSPDVNESGEVSARRYYDVATEPGGAFWLATSDGLFRYAPPIWRSPPSARNLNSPVHGMVSDAQSGLWFISGGSLHCLQEGSGQQWPLPGISARNIPAVNALFSFKNGTLLLDCGDQVLKFQPDSEKFSVVGHGSQNRFKVLGQFGDTRLCLQDLGTNESAQSIALELYDGEAFEPLPNPSAENAPGDEASAILAARSGDVWLAGNRGVSWYHDKKWRLFSAADKNAPASGQIFAELPDGKIWCGTQEKLWEFDGRNWSAFHRGFERINALCPTRDGSIWVASSGGLYRYLHNDWIENGPEEGLPGTEVRSLCEDARGRLWAGTARGLSLYHPEADLDPPKTMVQELDSPSKRIPQGTALRLSFSGEDKWKYTPRDRLLYSYRIDERDWSPFRDAATVTFGDLTAGKHYFQVRAMDRNCNIDANPARLEFSIVLPWYKEARLVLIAGAGLATALFFAGLAFNRHRQLLRSYAEVEKQVAERSQQLELANRELLHSQKMNALGTLAAGIAHDFNNILSIIKGSAQIIEDNLDNPQKVGTRVERIKTVVEQGAGIVKAMLGFSRDSSLQAGPSEVNAVVEDTIRLLGDRFLREVQVRFEPASNLPLVQASRDFVQQILLNFIFNASDAMSGRKEIILSTYSLDRLPADLVLQPTKATHYVAVAVRDFGCGITPENITRIFEPFFTTKAFSVRRGTGLGLSMVYELAKKMEAGLAVESIVQQGSTFTLIIPANLQGLPKEAPQPVANPELASKP